MLPNSTASTATSPGATSTPSRLASGLRSTSRPSPRRPIGQSRPISVEYTSNGSARLNHVSPKSAEPTSIAPTYRASQRRTDPRNVELSLTSSCQTNAKSPSDAGQ